MSAPFAGALLLAAALAAPDPTRGVTHIPAEEVKAAFVKGRPLIEVENYKVHASHRDAAGLAEVHVKDTDIIHVLAGTATFVTGGSLVDAKTVAPEELRGGGITGGETRALRPGDVVVVPSGVPHWFKDVPGPIDYYVVKVRALE